MIMGALCADAVIGNVQEKQMKAYKASNVEVVRPSFENYYKSNNMTFSFIFFKLKTGLVLILDRICVYFNRRSSF